MCLPARALESVYASSILVDLRSVWLYARRSICLQRRGLPVYHVGVP